MLEAATIDGAGAWRRFWYITVPMLKPVFAVVTILSTIWDFKVFTQIYLMPGGAGTNREVLNLGTWSYVKSISQNRYGLGAAIAVLLTAAAAGDHGGLPAHRCSGRRSCDELRSRERRRFWRRRSASLAVLGVHACSRC